jgi:hypothetical protein
LNHLQRAYLLQQNRRIMSERAILDELKQFVGSPFSADHLAQISGLPGGLVAMTYFNNRRSLKVNTADLDKLVALVKTGLSRAAIRELVERGTSIGAISELTGYSEHVLKRAARPEGPCEDCGWGIMKTKTLCEACHGRRRRDGEPTD